MSNKVQQLIAAASGNTKLGLTNNCPTVLVEISKFIYGTVENDVGDGTGIKDCSTPRDCESSFEPQLIGVLRRNCRNFR
ncbi:hypothetical protein [Citrobacter freundii]|uniref:hypothetical protein n=1 Tax=Citrobacter freundii TaxID=546 RepID=UPI001EF129AC|nr:hypothetical protein [Citrobacter freundii]